MQVLLVTQLHAAQVLRLDAKMKMLAEKLKHENSLLVFGRGYNYATALEAALKVGNHWTTSLAWQTINTAGLLFC